MNTRSTPKLRPGPANPIGRWLLATVLAIGLPLLAQAQATTGSITGRILNPTSGEYLRNVDVKAQGTNIEATSGDGGYYYLYNVPAGAATVVATYPGADAVTAQVTVTAGGTVKQDFEIKLQGSPQSSEEVVKLGAFVVETEREGQSKMVAEQKQSINVKEVVSTDVFGDMSEQNVGEFLKYLPGINIDYVETDTRSASMMGMDPKYGYVTLDGNSQASGDSGAFGGNSRQFEFESISMNNIESVEVNKTLTPDMWANAAAGTVNLRTRSAIDVKRPKFSFAAGIITNSMEAGFKRTPRHDDGLHAKTRPRLSFDYTTGPILGGKLGITVNGSFTSIYKEQFRESLSYDYTSTQTVAAGQPRVTAINYKDGPKISSKSAGGVKVDYQPFPNLRMTTAISYSYFDDFFANRNLNFVTNSANLGAGSSFTRVVAANSNNSNTRVDQSGENTGKLKDSTNLSYRVEYRQGPWKTDAALQYSRSRESRGGLFYGEIGNSPVRLSRIGFTAERPSVSSPEWTIQQTSGGNWYDWNNWGVYDAQDMNANRTINKTEQYTGTLNAQRVMSWSLPTTYKFGVGENVMTRKRWVGEQFVGRYVGPTGNALTSRLPQSKASFLIDKGWGGGLAPLPVVDKEAVYVLLRDHPEYFTQSPANIASQIDQTQGGFQSNQEDVRAGYVMQTTRLGKWTLLGGVRFENTRTTSRVPDEVPIPDNPFAIKGTKTASDGHVYTTYTEAKTPDYANYHWSRGLVTKWGHYNDWMPSAAAKYPFTPNLFLKLGYSKAVARPDLNRTAGPWDINTNDETGDITITIPNPNLKPERSETKSVMLEYYTKSGGSASIHLYQIDIKNAVDNNPDGIPAEEAGFGGIPEFEGVFFKTYFNIPDERRVRGYELSLSQSLRFLSNPWIRSTTFFANYSQRTATPRPWNGTRFVPRTASGGVRWNYGRVGVSVNGTWTDETFTGSNSVPTNSIITPGAPEYLRPRIIMFVNATYRLTTNLSLFVAGDRAYDSGKIWYYKYDGRIRQIEKYGSQWSLGVKGDF